MLSRKLVQEWVTYLVRRAPSSDLQHSDISQFRYNTRMRYDSSVGASGGRAYSFAACLSRLTIDHAPLPFETEHHP